MQKEIAIGFVAPSSVVPQVELALGLDRIQSEGFQIDVHPQCRKRHLFLAGTDQERAEALYEYALRPDLPIVWAARGGYGAFRLLPILEELTRKRGIPPKKLYIGYSDSTVMLDYLRRRWGWSVLHAPMPGLREFCKLSKGEWKMLVHAIRGKLGELDYGKPLRFFGPAPKAPVEGPIVGGNLAVWVSMLGTRFSPQASGSLLFFEDLGEAPYRLDRLVQQLVEAGGLEGVRAVILGNFADCEDKVTRHLRTRPSPKQLARVLRDPKPTELKPLRPAIPLMTALAATFGELGERYGIPIAYGLPVGHGKDKLPLPIGATATLQPSGKFLIRAWDWPR